ncbi:MAG: hypothetical protein NXH75_00035 [Halobacteriovoraceae bacterium]|nr:hypothetical protein [Halobacteriovoraceae bacterium]
MLVERRFLGIGKNIYNSAVTELIIDDGEASWKTIITERWDKKKYSGAWPVRALDQLDVSSSQYVSIGENRDITQPKFFEDLLQKKSPFFEKCKAKKIEFCLSEFNPSLHQVNHHEAHAYSALAQLPFSSSFILVMDGGGSRLNDSEYIEHTTLFYFDGKRLETLEKEWLRFDDFSGSPHKLAEGIGSFYERCAQLIFNDNLSSGKVMGLAGFGKSFYDSSKSLVENQENLDWSKAFKGTTKKEWQESKNLAYWQDVAATVQEAFEKNLFRWHEKIIGLSSEKSLNLVLTGGCALNCTANYKLFKKGEFAEVYIPPNPGDEGISLGIAYKLAFEEGGLRFSPTGYEKQSSSRGEVHDFSPEKIEKAFKDYEKVVLENWEEVAVLLEEGEIIAWIQGRSECGPRALGHRSLLAKPDRTGLKEQLNSEVKFRESFRPYGASVLWEKAEKYFDVPNGFQNPFMSFATPIQKEYLSQLHEVSHVDGTCRMQTVMKGQNSSYYELLETCEKKGMLPVLLNTSLNIMGQPILETLEDAIDFFTTTSINHMVIGNWLISKEKKEKN